MNTACGFLDLSAKQSPSNKTHQTKTRSKHNCASSKEAACYNKQECITQSKPAAAKA
jgi:hypothetical protein